MLQQQARQDKVTVGVGSAVLDPCGLHDLAHSLISLMLSLVRLFNGTWSCSHSYCAIRERWRQHDGLPETGITGLLALCSGHGLPQSTCRLSRDAWHTQKEAAGPHDRTLPDRPPCSVLAANKVLQLIDEVWQLLQLPLRILFKWLTLSHLLLLHPGRPVTTLSRSRLWRLLSKYCAIDARQSDKTLLHICLTSSTNAVTSSHDVSPSLPKGHCELCAVCLNDCQQHCPASYLHCSAETVGCR